MTRTLVRLLLVIGCLAVWPASAAASHVAQPLYGADGGGGVAGNLYELDPATGAVVRTIGPIGHPVTGLAVNPSDCSMWGVTGRENTASNPNPGHLIRIDKSTGQGTVVGDLFEGTTAPVADITFTPDGVLYGWSENTDDLVTIDTASGAATVVGDSGIGTAGSGLASSSGGTLYFTGSGDNGPLHTIDRSDGQPTTVADLDGTTGRNISALAFSPNDTLFGVRREAGDQQELITINPSTGAIDVRGALANRIEGIAFDCHPAEQAQAQPQPQPQPQPEARDSTAPRVTIAGVRRTGCTSRDFRSRFSLRDESALRRADVYLDGRRVRRTTRKQFSVLIRASRLRSGRHRITLIARDTAGNRTARTVRFRRCARPAQRRAPRRAPSFTG